MNTPQKLKQVLYANALFSSLSGLCLIVFHQDIAQLMHIVQPKILLALGLGLLVFAATLIWEAKQNPLQNHKIKWIIFQDWLWVAASALIIILQAFQLSNLAYLIILLVAIIVATFALLQKKYLSKLEQS